MSGTTLEIKFTGDSAFLDALVGDARPVPTTRTVPPTTPGEAPKVERIPPSEVAERLAHETARASGETGKRLSDTAKDYENKFNTTRDTIQDLINSAKSEPKAAPAAPKGGAPTVAQATGAEASSAAAGAATRGGAAASGAEAGAAGAAGGGAAVAGAAAIVVVGLIALGAALKKVNETALESVEKFRDINGTIAATAATIDVNKQLREMRRAENLAPDLAKIATANDKIAGSIYEFGTQGMVLLNKILVAILPMFETLYDFTKEATAQFAKFNAWLASWSSEKSDAERAELDRVAKEAADAAEKAWENKDLESGDELEADARKMADNFLRDFGMGGGGPRIPPSR